MRISELLEAYDEWRHTLAIINSKTNISIEALSGSVDLVMNSYTPDKLTETLSFLNDASEQTREIFDNSNYWSVLHSIGDSETKMLAKEWMELEERIENYIRTLK